MKYISWNCKGLGNKLKEEALKDIVRIHSPEILLIQETKMEDNPLLQNSKTFWRKGPGRAVSAKGASGELASFWDSSKYELIQEENGSHWIFTLLLHKDSGQQVRDLNVTLAIDEKKGGSPVRDPAREWVEDIMLDWDLEDIKPTAGKYTWTNKRLGPNHIAARLDRFLVQSSFLTCGLSASSKILPNCTFDHKPISLELTLDGNLCPIPSRFSAMWIQQDGFQEVVSKAWN
eukprot:PITA_32065